MLPIMLNIHMVRMVRMSTMHRSEYLSSKPENQTIQTLPIGIKIKTALRTSDWLF